MGSVKRVAQLFVSGRACNGLHRRCGCCAARVERRGAYSLSPPVSPFLSFPASRLDRRSDDEESRLGPGYPGLTRLETSLPPSACYYLLASGRAGDGGNYVRSMSPGRAIGEVDNREFNSNKIPLVPRLGLPRRCVGGWWPQWRMLDRIARAFIIKLLKLEGLAKVRSSF